MAAKNAARVVTIVICIIWTVCGTNADGTFTELQILTILCRKNETEAIKYKLGK